MHSWPLTVERESSVVDFLLKNWKAMGCSSSVVFHSTIYACDLCGRWAVAMALMERLVAAGFKDGNGWTWGDDSWFLTKTSVVSKRNELDLQAMACETLKLKKAMTKIDGGGTNAFFKTLFIHTCVNARKTSWFAGKYWVFLLPFAKLDVWDRDLPQDSALNPQIFYAIDHWKSSVLQYNLRLAVPVVPPFDLQCHFLRLQNGLEWCATSERFKVRCRKRKAPDGSSSQPWLT